MKALGLGAFDFVTKPKEASAHMAETAARIDRQDQGGGGARACSPQFLPGDLPGTAARQTAAGRSDQNRRHRRLHRRTAGPAEYVLSQLPAEFPGAITVVQHMPEGFTDMFARRLDESLSVARERSAVGRRAAGRTSADLSRKPAHEGETTAAGRRGVCSGMSRAVNGHRPSRGRAVPQRGRANSVRRRSAC